MMNQGIRSENEYHDNRGYEGSAVSFWTVSIVDAILMAILEFGAIDILYPEMTSGDSFPIGLIAAVVFFLGALIGTILYGRSDGVRNSYKPSCYLWAAICALAGGTILSVIVALIAALLYLVLIIFAIAVIIVAYFLMRLLGAD